jgi:predicted N-acetyltransferase YhbS
MTGAEMDYGAARAEDAPEIAALFAATFTAAGGTEEGRLIGGLAADMMALVPSEDIAVFVCRRGGVIGGCIMFSRLRMAAEDRWVVLLSPVAVATDLQGRGVGQALLRHGLDVMRARGAHVAVTYGNPRYYARVGFRPVDAATVPPPRPLRHPGAWLAQSLTDAPLVPLRGPSACFAALDREEYW